ncbi:hypothetical protein D9758_008668 [Tetrapyrgos nigripes]|uniref:Zinc finger PHD-type domain-containing protein n=1 Tax=Tetrapyrgos nigripes TaxID=182062 RepID=A0A8H5D6K6_9AGAR|nr:hypothetical protein D9758_008668 [Tetrapyrgos nigripes]
MPNGEPTEKNEKGHVKCPDCGTYVNPGAASAEAILKRHRGTNSCNDARARRDKQKSGPKQKTLFSMFANVPKAKPIPSLVNTPEPICPQPIKRDVKMQRSHRASDLEVTSLPLLESLRLRILDLPTNLEDAGESHELSAFASAVQPEDPQARGKRKRTMTEKMKERQRFSSCCDKVIADINDPFVIRCGGVGKANGCETGYYHLACAGLTRRESSWICETCESQRVGKRGKH